MAIISRLTFVDKSLLSVCLQFITTLITTNNVWKKFHWNVHYLQRTFHFHELNAFYTQKNTNIFRLKTKKKKENLEDVFVVIFVVVVVIRFA